MNGARALLTALEANQVDTVFTNPGTTEIHLVSALDDAPGVNAVLCLFEGVATGAADGYARASGRAAATLVHLGPGLANGWANLHNARRARSPVLNIVGDHPDFQRLLDPPLNSNVAALAGALEGWHHRIADPNDVAGSIARALSAAYGPPGQIATLILDADVAWGEVTTVTAAWPLATPSGPVAPGEDALNRTLEVLRTKRTALFVGGSATTAEQLALARRLADATSSRVIMETFPAIFDHGVGVVSPERLIYFSDFALAQLRDLEALVLVGAMAPVPPFAYQAGPAGLVPEGCEVIELAPPGTDTLTALSHLVDATNAPVLERAPASALVAPSGPLEVASLAAAIAATMPEGLLISDESNTSGLHLYGAAQFAAPHRVMTLTGNSIGFGLPVALGAAYATRQRVLALEADGSMMYTLQALWTMAREGLDVTVLALANRSYAVVDLELRRIAPTARARSQRVLDLDDPVIDLAGLARAQGVPSVRVTSADELVVALRQSYATPGPMFIEAVLPRGLV